MNSVTIKYCKQCKWLTRSSWMAQELLTTFSDELQEVKLQSGSGGIFEIYANKSLIWERKRDEGFPEITELKRLVREQIAPEKHLGHVEKK